MFLVWKIFMKKIILFGIYLAWNPKSNSPFKSKLLTHLFIYFLAENEIILLNVILT